MYIEHLTFSYKNLLVFDDFNFQSSESLIAFKGPSGCGKTTLLKIISKNLNPENNSYIQYSQNTFFVIQEDSLFPWLTGEENISKFTSIEKDRIHDHKIFPHLMTFYKKKVFEMSFGQRRMIELFRALLFQPDLLLLDEPFSFLDRKSRELFAEEILSILDTGIKIIITSHYNEDLSFLNPKLFYFDNIFPIHKLYTEGELC